MDESWLGLLTPVQLQAVSVRRLRELKKTRDRLNQSPSNSSKPPSSRPAWETSPATGATSAQAPASEAATAADGSAPDAGQSSPSPAASSGRARTSGGRPTGRKAGKQPGAKGQGRTQQFAVDDTVAHYPEHCAVCGLALTREGAQAYTGWDEIEIAASIAGPAGLRLQLNRHLLHASACG